MIKKAFILGAGLGTRLRPLTETVPKPLIPIFHKPLITFALDHLISAGIESFVINSHRLAEKFEDYFKTGYYRGKPVTLINEPVLLETGGGIKNAERFLNDGNPFVTYSGDLLTDLPLDRLVDEHLRNGNDVTLGLRDTGLGSSIALRHGRIVDIGNKYGVAGQHDFANVAVWNPSIFNRLLPNKKISLIPIVVEWIGQNGKIGGVVLNDGNWFNVGSPADYLRVHRAILLEKRRPTYVNDPGWPQPIHPTAAVVPSAQLVGCTVIGANCKVESDAVLEDTILWSGAQIASRSHLSRCIVRSHKSAAGEHTDAVI
jgi:NDP-sugar pyrophosphorylase family protein